eukprot:1131636-Rhodomonas_salina.1
MALTVSADSDATASSKEDTAAMSVIPHSAAHDCQDFDTSLATTRSSATAASPLGRSSSARSR